MSKYNIYKNSKDGSPATCPNCGQSLITNKDFTYKEWTYSYSCTNCNTRLAYQYPDGGDAWWQTYKHKDELFPMKSNIQCVLNRYDLLSSVKGTSPNYEVMDNVLVKQNGSYIGGLHDKWRWEIDEYNMSNIQLLELYRICKYSWKDNKYE